MISIYMIIQIQTKEYPSQLYTAFVVGQLEIVSLYKWASDICATARLFKLKID